MIKNLKQVFLFHLLIKYGKVDMILNRILTDGYFFGTITELLVLPEYQKHGIGSKLLHLAKETSPTMLYFGAQPGVEAFYEKNGCKKSLQSYMIEKDKF